ncbi:MAG: hypothetical protein WCY09_08560, partial [Candidatus Omnitrophota bacterium]
MPDNIRSFEVEGKVLDIPESEVSAFLSDVPTAKEVKSFIVGRDTLDIPETEVSDFLKDIPDAKPLKNYVIEQPEKKNGSGESSPPVSENLRPDGTQKGTGYFGELKRPDGRVSTELSIGVNIGGKDIEIPSLVPTLDEKEKQYLLNTPEDKIFTANPEIYKGIEQKAIDHAKKRIAEGKSPFADNSESPQQVSEKSQPNITAPPEYSINGTKYTDKDTFLKEVVKYQGKDTTPEFTVSNDEETLNKAKEIVQPKPKTVLPNKFANAFGDNGKEASAKGVTDAYEGLKATGKSLAGAVGVASLDLINLINEGASKLDTSEEGQKVYQETEKKIAETTDKITKWAEDVPDPVDSWGYKMGGMLPFLGSAVLATVTRSPAIARATTGMFGVMGFGEGLMKADKKAEETGDVSDAQRYGTALIYTAAYTAPMAEWMGKLLPKKLIGNVITGIMKKNPEMANKTATAVWDGFLKQNPEKAKMILDYGKKMGIGAVHSTAALTAMEGGKILANSLVLGEEWRSPISLETTGTGIVFGFVTKPFVIHAQSKTIIERRRAQGQVQLSVSDNGVSFEVVKDAEGNYVGVLPNETTIKIKPEKVQEVLNNSITIPTPIFEQSLKQGMEKVNETVKITSDKLTDLNELVKAKTPDADILAWATQMKDLGRIDEGTFEEINKNIIAKRNAEKDLNIAEWDAPPEIRSRLAQLHSDRVKYEGSKSFRKQLKAVNDEIAYILENKKLLEVEPLKTENHAIKERIKPELNNISDIGANNISNLNIKGSVSTPSPMFNIMTISTESNEVVKTIVPSIPVNMMYDKSKFIVNPTFFASDFSSAIKRGNKSPNSIFLSPLERSVIDSRTPSGTEFSLYSPASFATSNDISAQFASISGDTGERTVVLIPTEFMGDVSNSAILAYTFDGRIFKPTGSGTIDFSLTTPRVLPFELLSANFATIHDYLNKIPLNIYNKYNKKINNMPLLSGISYEQFNNNQDVSEGKITESNQPEHQGTLQGQPEVGQGEGTERQAEITGADNSNRNEPSQEKEVGPVEEKGKEKAEPEVVSLPSEVKWQKKEPYQMTGDEFASMVGSPKPTIEIASDVSFHQLSKMSEAEKSRRFKEKQKTRLTETNKYNDAINEWKHSVWQSYLDGKYNAKDVFDTDSFYVLSENLPSIGLDIKSPFRISQMGETERLKYLDAIDKAKQAIVNGESVPQSVLADYPELSKEEKKTENKLSIEDSKKISIVAPKSIRDVYKAGREIFKLNKVQALAQAIVVDRVIGTIARRRGITKAEVYKEVKFTNETLLTKKGVLFQQQSKIGFYSTIDKALEGIKQEKGTFDQFKAMLLKNGAKQAEMDWMGFDEQFKDSKSVTKKDIQDWIDQNNIKVEEVQKGDYEDFSWDEQGLDRIQIGSQRTIGNVDVKRISEDEYEWYENGGYIDNGDYESLINDLDRNYSSKQAGTTKFSQYVLPGGPLSRDAEILTNIGWVRMDEIKIGDVVLSRKDEGGLIEYVPVEAVPTVFAEKLYHFKSQSVDMMVTEHHQMVVEKRFGTIGNRRRELVRMTASELWKTWDCRIPLTGKWNGLNPETIFGLDAGDVMEFIGWFLSEGWSVKSKQYQTKTTIGIGQSKENNPQKSERLENLFNRLGFTWNYVPSGMAYYVGIKSMPKELVNLCHLQGTACIKSIPNELFQYSIPLLKRLQEAMILGDGCITVDKTGVRKDRKNY